MVKAFGAEQEVKSPALVGQTSRPNIPRVSPSNALASSFNRGLANITELAKTLNDEKKDRDAGKAVADANNRLILLNESGANAAVQALAIRREKNKFLRERGLTAGRVGVALIGRKQLGEANLAGGPQVTFEGIGSGNTISQGRGPRTGEDIFDGQDPNDVHTAEVANAIQDESIKVSANFQRFAAESGAFMNGFAKAGGQISGPHLFAMTKSVNDLADIANDANINVGIQRLGTGISDPKLFKENRIREADKVITQIGLAIGGFSNSQVAQMLRDGDIAPSDLVRFGNAIMQDFFGDARNTGLFESLGLTDKIVRDAFTANITSLKEWAEVAVTRDLKKLQQKEEQLITVNNIKLQQKENELFNDKETGDFAVTLAVLMDLFKDADSFAKTFQNILNRDNSPTTSPLLRRMLQNTFKMVQGLTGYKSDLKTIQGMTIKKQADAQTAINQIVKTMSDPLSAVTTEGLVILRDKADEIHASYPNVKNSKRLVDALNAKIKETETNLKKNSADSSDVLIFLETVVNKVTREKKPRTTETRTSQSPFDPDDVGF